ncbi:hypothetical protein Psi02_38650 [Planotetraspora silvatica]|uniref:Uncharacterized protein n=1 Tax=Planotetraspora silvatica TaxID=234614 RepID=A0A8J3UN39_9ACTN|nr:hypothetical protein [Planotetraspora silvatica]GII47441.1 hypothetical protein Psi02_38650 [Planotetraspora silvatica]
MGLSPSWALSGQAVDGVGDAHLATGVHYRVLTNPLLGLPVVPLSIGRITLGEMAKGHTRRDVTWVDSRGNMLTAPFTVTPDNPVTGHLPLGETCCWAALEGTAARGGPRPPVPPRPPRPPFLVPPRAGEDAQTADVRPIVVRPGAGPVPQAGLPASFWVEGVVATPYGDAPVAIRSAEPFHVYASHLERIVVHGNGTVTGLSWLPASAVDVFERFRTAPLPTGPGVRYAGPADGEDRGFERVKRGAPARFGMHESPLAASPTACAPVSAGEESDRVAALTGELAKSLDRLVNDTSAPQRLLTSSTTVRDENGTALGDSQRYILMDLLQGAVDPGVARWLGFLDVDEDVPPKNVVVAYVVDGLFAPDWKSVTSGRLDQTLPFGTVVEDGAKAVMEMARRAPELADYAAQVARMGRGPFLQLRVVLAATAGVPLDSPAAPGLDTPASGDWLPATAPTAARELTVSMEHLVPGAGLGSAIAQPSGDKPLARNPEEPKGRRLLLTTRLDDAAVRATSGMLADRLVDERDGSWQVAQADWFGRWSAWAGITFAAAARPRPPRPVFTLTTRPPVVPTPVPAGPLAGAVRVEVSVPPVSGLPAGGRLLRHLKLTVTSGGVPVQTIHPIASPAAPPETLVIEVPGPALPPTASGTVTVTAVWTDSAGIDSGTSEPKQATLHDPRPPEPVIIPPTLTYTARPDATGRARTALRWTPGAGQAAYRVFVADETTLRAKLKDTATGVIAEGDAGQAPTSGQAAALLAALDAAPDAPARGAVWDAGRRLLPRRWWLQLTAEPLPRPVSGQAVFTHDVSGSLSVLVLYRVVAVSSASVESDFATCPLLPRAVPNLLVPPVPTLDVLPVVDGSADLLARLTVTVPVGPTPAVRYRLRRATATTDPVFMPVVAEGAIPPRPVGAPAPQVFTILDAGASPSEARTTLSAWLRYNWRVEVQGAPAPGGGPAGEWSAPSAAASTTVMPPDPPAAVSDLTVTRDADGVHVRFGHPEPLAGGATAGYTVDVYRQCPGGSLRLLTSLPGQAPPPTGRGPDVTGSFDVLDPGAEAVTGTLYRVVVTDPIGRASQPSTPQEAP